MSSLSCIHFYWLQSSYFSHYCFSPNSWLPLLNQKYYLPLNPRVITRESLAPWLKGGVLPSLRSIQRLGQRGCDFVTFPQRSWCRAESSTSAGYCTVKLLLPHTITARQWNINMPHVKRSDTNWSSEPRAVQLTLICDFKGDSEENLMPYLHCILLFVG